MNPKINQLPHFSSALCRTIGTAFTRDPVLPISPSVRGKKGFLHTRKYPRMGDRLAHAINRKDRKERRD